MPAEEDVRFPCGALRELIGPDYFQFQTICWNSASRVNSVTPKTQSGIVSPQLNEKQMTPTVPSLLRS